MVPFPPYPGHSLQSRRSYSSWGSQSRLQFPFEVFQDASVTNVGLVQVVDVNGSHDSSGTAGVGGVDSNDIVDFATETDGVYLRCGAGSFICYARADLSTAGIERVGLSLDEYVSKTIVAFEEEKLTQ